MKKQYELDKIKIAYFLLSNVAYSKNRVLSQREKQYVNQLISYQWKNMFEDENQKLPFEEWFRSVCETPDFIKYFDIPFFRLKATKENIKKYYAEVSYKVEGGTAILDNESGLFTILVD